MVQIKKKIDSFKYNLESFDSVLEFSDYLKKKPISPAYAHDYTCHAGDLGRFEFYNVHTVDEARELLENGWIEEVKKNASKFNEITKTGYRTRKQSFNNVCGFLPNVPNAIIGLPNSMIDMRKIDVKSKVITIIYDSSCPHYVTPEEMIQSSLNLVKEVTNLEMSGYRCEVKIFTSHVNKKNKTCYGALVTVKKANQSLNFQKMLFPMAHPAWLRVMSFDWLEKSEAPYMPGRGVPFCFSDFRKLDLESLLGKNTVYLNYKITKNGTEDIKRVITSKE